MAFATRVTRIANPHHSRMKRSYRRKRANASAMVPVKRKRRNRSKVKVYRTKSGRFTRRKPNTGHHRTRRTKARTTNRVYRRRAKRSNPILLEFGALNPFRGGTSKRRKSVARKRKYRRSSNPTRRRAKTRRVYHRRRRSTNRRSNYRRRRRSNPVAVAPVRRHRRRRSYRRSRNRGRRRMNYRRRRHNPSLFGRSGMKDLLLMVGGGLVGVAATKYLPTLIPASMLTSFGSSSLVSVAITGAGAFVAGWLAGKISKEFGEAVLFGGLMQTGSALLNAFAPPSVSGALALSGVGDIVPTGMFPVPNNQFRSYVPPAPPSAANGSKGVGAFRGAFGYRR